MHIGFRVDASLQIGSGHVVRCLTLADALRTRGARCTFVCREQDGNLLSLIKQRGHAALSLPVIDSVIDVPVDLAHSAWLRTSWNIDAVQTQQALLGQSIDWLVVDHYALDCRWEQDMRGLCNKILVIDDLADRPHDCNLLLDQNLGRTSQDYLGLLIQNSEVLIGPRYALLRPEFEQWRAKSLIRRAKGEFKHLLITLGGVDNDNVTGKVLNELKKSKLSTELHITVVMGATAPWQAKVQDQAKQMPWPTNVLVGVSNMAELMAKSSLAIGAAGSTAWERCSLGLPTLMVVLAENQTHGANALQNSGAALLMKSINDIPKILDTYQISGSMGESLKKMSEIAAGITDGQGTNYIADKMIGVIYD